MMRAGSSLIDARVIGNGPVVDGCERASGPALPRATVCTGQLLIPSGLLVANVSPNERSRATMTRAGSSLIDAPVIGSGPVVDGGCERRASGPPPPRATVCTGQLRTTALIPS